MFFVEVGEKNKMFFHAKIEVMPFDSNIFFLGKPIGYSTYNLTIASKL
jgi:hypothetical protein